MKLLKEVEVAKILNLHQRTLARWRFTGGKQGPRWVKIGTAVRYPESELDKYIKSLKYHGTVKEVSEEVVEENKDKEFDYYI